MATLHENTAALVAAITAARNRIRNKFVEMGIAQSAADLEDLAGAAEGIENRGSISATVREGETYTIPQGYHPGTGTVSGVGGGGSYSLQSKKVTPTKTKQQVTADEGYYGLSDVEVGAIPDNYNDTGAVTAVARDVLSGKVFVDAAGNVKPGEMPVNENVSKTLDATANNQEYTIPEGYHPGTGKAKIVLEEKSVTPTKSAQTITPTTGKVLAKVEVAEIPDNYVDKTGAQAISLTINPLTQDSVTIPEGYTLGGNVTLTDDLYKALAAI